MKSLERNSSIGALAARLGAAADAAARAAADAARAARATADAAAARAVADAGHSLILAGGATGSFVAATHVVVVAAENRRRKKNSSRADINGVEGGVVFDDEFIVVEILSRLPVKSLLRFKCVSKRWFSLIQDPYLVDLHSARSKTRPGATFFISTDHYGCNITFFGSTSYDGPHFHSINYIDNPVHSFDKFGPQFYVEDNDFYQKLNYTQILNGLLLMSFKEETIWILNPSTRKTILLTKTNFKEEEEEQEAIDNKNEDQYNWMHIDFVVRPSYWFGFDPVMKKYKVISTCLVLKYYVPFECFLYNPYDTGIEHEFDSELLTSYYRCKVLTIKDDVVDCCWRRVDEIPPKPLTGDVVCVNGALYWWNMNKIQNADQVIVAFDISTEKFSVIKTPADFVCQPRDCAYVQKYKQELYEVDGCLAILDNVNTAGPNTIEIWKLAPVPEAANLSCWVKETILTLSFDWRKEGYRFEVIGNQILLKRYIYHGYQCSRVTPSFYYYNRDKGGFVDHGNKTRKKTSTCDGDKLLFTGKAALFTHSFPGLVVPRNGLYRTFYSCTESLWSLNSQS